MAKLYQRTETGVEAFYPETTAQQVKTAGGVAVEDALQGIDDALQGKADAAALAEAQAGLTAANTALAKTQRYTQLFYNAAPANPFAAQTLALDLSGYQAVMLEYFVCGSQVGYTNRVTVSVGRSASIHDELVTAAYIVCAARNLTVTASGITLESAYVHYEGANAAGSVSNYYLVPWRVFGVQGV